MDKVLKDILDEITHVVDFAIIQYGVTKDINLLTIPMVALEASLEDIKNSGRHNDSLDEFIEKIKLLLDELYDIKKMHGDMEE